MAKILFSIQHADDVLPQEDRHTPGIRKGWDSKSRDNFQRQRQQCQNGAVQHFHTAARCGFGTSKRVGTGFCVCRLKKNQTSRRPDYLATVADKKLRGHSGKIEK